MTVRILCGDTLNVLSSLPAQSVQACVTSPPYYGLRSYLPDGHPDKHLEIGLEASPDEYVARLGEVFREVRRVLRDDGVLWLNLGDSYASTPPGNKTLGVSAASGLNGVNGASGRYRETLAAGHATKRDTSRLDGYKPKDLLGIPWLVAFALRADGWYLRSDVIWCLSGGTRVYAKTQKGEMPMTIKDMVRLDPATVQLWNGEKWTQVLGWGQTPRPDRTYEIELRNGQRIGCTGNHEWPVAPCGNIRTDELKVGDIIRRCQLPEPTEAKHPAALDDALVGWFIGTYIADGSMSGDTIQIASHANEEQRFERLSILAGAFHGTLAIHKTSDKGCTANLKGPMLRALVETYVSGDLAHGKHLHPRCWQRSNAFINAVLRGYVDGDGHWDEKNQRWRLGFCSNDELVADLRAIGARLGASVRLKRVTHKMGDQEFPGYKGEIRTHRSDHWNSKDDGEIVAIRESRARKFWDIAVADEPHLFALASGILTHNCKPNPMPESVRDRPTKAHEYVFLLSKGPRYFYDADAIKEESVTDDPRRPYGSKGAWDLDGRPEEQRPNGKLRALPNRKRGEFSGKTKALSEREAFRAFTETRNARSVWTIATQPFKESHFATMPPELAERCIKAGSRPGDTILDPFGGAGTTGLVADRLGRHATLIELNAEYAGMARRRLSNDAPLLTEVTHA